MFDICAGTEEELDERLKRMEDVGVYVDVAFLACCAIVTCSATFYVFCTKNSD